jgi:cellulose synthase/poly-beta-1,6-N-acetylglucosamine synthase-like glycosyltransferase
MSSIINKNPMISIIIPCKKIDNYTRECIEYCKKLNYDSYEIIVLPDNSNENIEGVNIIPTGNVTPGKKKKYRNKECKRRNFSFHRFRCKT